MDRKKAEKEALKNALLNAIEHGGKAQQGPVLGKIMASDPELRSAAKEVMPIVGKVIKNVNSMRPSDQIRTYEKEFGPLDTGQEEKEEKGPSLPSLPGGEKGVVVRFAPGPSGPLHIGHSRAAILNDEYVKRYGGKYILRLEDTNPNNIMPDAYDMIPKDMEWLGTKVHDITIQSDRFDIYLKWARELLEMGHAYVCDCEVEEWRALKEEMKGCPHRSQGPEDNLSRWDKMLDGGYVEGETSLVVKTDIDHPNPAVRDFVAMRILDTPHPRTGNEHSLYPLYNFSVAVDDHLMDITHVLRGKDHLNNTIRQRYVYRYLGWPEPEFIHYGWVSIKDTILKTTTIKQGIEKGKYSGWNDPRLGTFRALEARGVKPEALRRYWLEVGVGEVDIKFSWQNLYAFNKSLVEDEADRFFFVKDPIEVNVMTDRALQMKAPVHPNHPDRGYRSYELEPKGGKVGLYVAEEDFKNTGPEVYRLKDLCNVEPITGGKGNTVEYAGNDLEVIKQGARIIHCVPRDHAVPATVRMPDGTSLEGYAEDLIGKVKPNTVVQFERFGFVNLLETGERVVANFTHK